MKRLSLVTFFCSGLIVGSVSDGHAQPDLATGQEGDDILEVLMLPVEMQEASASGMSNKEVEGVVEAFRESGMPPGEAASVIRFERTLSARRGLKKGFSGHVLRRLSDGAATTEVIASLREREASDPLGDEEHKRLKKSASRRAKMERTRTKARRKRDREKRARGEKVIIRGQMRMMPSGEGQGDLRPPEAKIDLPWLQKRLEMVQRRMIRLDTRAGKMKEKAVAKGHDKQRERLLKEREVLVGFIDRMKALDAEGQFEGSARDQLLDEIKDALKIDRRRMPREVGRGDGKGAGAGGERPNPRGPDGEALADPREGPQPPRGPNGRGLGGRAPEGGQGPKGDKAGAAMNGGAGDAPNPGGDAGTDHTSLKGPKGPRGGDKKKGDRPSGANSKELRGNHDGQGKAK